jgi:phage tail sheath protein FI
MEKPFLVDELFSKWAPGVYRSEQFAQRPSEFSTGMPAFIGTIPHTHKEAFKKPRRLHFWPQFKLQFATNETEAPDCMLAYAVRGFFQNGGRQCYVVALHETTEATLRKALEKIASLDVDLVCVPDLALIAESSGSPDHSLEQVVVKHCEDMGDRFAILDSHKGASRDDVWKQWSDIDGKNGAIYYPWLKVRKFADSEPTKLVPPCGHVAGVYARTDHARGVHKAPANEVLEGVLDLEYHLTSRDQDYLNPKRVNCIRSFPGRGIRVWGARTLSGQDDWTYVNVRRIFLTAVRWIHWHLGDVAFEPNDAQLWARIDRELNLYFLGLYRQGALKGRDPREAYYVKCDATTNPREVRDLGQVITEIGLAPAKPYEFVVVRLIHGQTGVSVSGPIRPEQN